MSHAAGAGTGSRGTSSRPGAVAPGALVVAAVAVVVVALVALVALVAQSAGPTGSAWSDGSGTTVTEADGVLPDGVTVLDEEYPGVADLDPDLLRALRDASADAADVGIELRVTSGWRSPAYQDELLHEAVSTYGSQQEAARWVATADTSPHVSGDAVDVGPAAAQAWLSRHGAGYGLCRVYRNEPWHYELRPRAIDHGCPATYADPTRDPRMRADLTPRSRTEGEDRRLGSPDSGDLRPLRAVRQ